MTLIALHAFGDASRPVFVSDLLVSSPGEKHERPTLPTVGEIGPQQPYVPGYRVSGLRQKVAIIRDDLAIAAAGPPFNASLLSREVYERLAQTAPSEVGDIHDVLVSVMHDKEVVESLAKGGLSVIASHMYMVNDTQQNGTTASLAIPPARPRAYKSSVFGQVVAFGSGASTYAQLAGTLQLTEPGPEFVSGYYRDLTHVLIPACRFLANESHTGWGTLAEAWGGDLR